MAMAVNRRESARIFVPPDGYPYSSPEYWSGGLSFIAMTPHPVPVGAPLQRFIEHHPSSTRLLQEVSSIGELRQYRVRHGNREEMDLYTFLPSERLMLSFELMRNAALAMRYVGVDATFRELRLCIDASIGQCLEALSSRTSQPRALPIDLRKHSVSQHNHSFVLAAVCQ